MSEEDIKICVSENDILFVSELIDLYREDIKNTIRKVLDELPGLEKRLEYYLDGINLFDKREAFKAKRFSLKDLLELRDNSMKVYSSSLYTIG